MHQLKKVPRSREQFASSKVDLKFVTTKSRQIGQIALVWYTNRAYNMLLTHRKFRREKTKKKILTFSSYMPRGSSYASRSLIFGISLHFPGFPRFVGILLICWPTKFFLNIPEEVSFLKSSRESILMKKLMTFFSIFVPQLSS